MHGRSETAQLPRQFRRPFSDTGYLSDCPTRARASRSLVQPCPTDRLTRSITSLQHPSSITTYSTLFDVNHLGITCDFRYLSLRYNWADLKTFIERYF